MKKIKLFIYLVNNNFNLKKNQLCSRVNLCTHNKKANIPKATNNSTSKLIVKNLPYFGVGLGGVFGNGVNPPSNPVPSSDYWGTPPPSTPLMFTKSHH